MPGHDELTVTRELIDTLGTLLHDPDVPLRVVRVHFDGMGTDKEVVVALPRVDEVTVPVEDHEDALPTAL